MLIFEFHKMEFVFQEIQKDPKHLQLQKNHRFSHNCQLYVYRATQNFSAEVLLQFYISFYLSICGFTAILACFCTFWYLFQRHLCIRLYFVVVCTFTFASQAFMIPFLALIVLHCITVFCSDQVLVLFHIHIFS